ncbi:MAG TPA: hypothetical protein DEA82_05975 [Flavobacteriaceae bacterium]|nr:hypothetical protein [Flavobacteriaceae bacterium]HBR53744.1 hypothetical protein [Flavobacteriaceae bacterium]
MKKILIPIDLKLNSYEAIDYAIKFFKREQCEFYFLNTYTYDLSGLNTIDLLQADDDWYDKPKHDSEDSLGKIIQKYAFNNREAKHRFSAISEYSNLIEGMKKAIKDIKIDLVVLPGKDRMGEGTMRYSRNTKRIIEHIRECPVMIIPASAKMHKKPKFALVSSFDLELPLSELENWYGLVQIAKGSIKIVMLSGKTELSELQKANQNKVRFHLELLSEEKIQVEYVKNAPALKDFARLHSDYIMCLIDRKPDLWRKMGVTHSKITTLGPMPSTPVIALHR